MLVIGVIGMWYKFLQQQTYPRGQGDNIESRWEMKSMAAIWCKKSKKMKKSFKKNCL